MIALTSIVIGAFLPFVGLPIAMVSVVAVAVAEIQDPRLRYPTVGLVVISIAINLGLVLMALPAGRQFVESLSL